uniref:Uncharacterized protein n=1 Tax=Macrostomum lignano TaxID=282301 RepID=A0A1I8FMJ9_9PLAT
MITIRLMMRTYAIRRRRQRTTRATIRQRRVPIRMTKNWRNGAQSRGLRASC